MKIEIQASGLNNKIHLITYSSTVNKEVDLLIKQKINQITDEIIDFIPQRELINVASISFVVDQETDDVDILIKKANEDTPFDQGSMNSESVLRLKELVQMIHRIGIPNLDKLVPALIPSPFRIHPETEAIKKGNLIVKIFRQLQYWISSILYLDPAVKKFTHTYFSSVKNIKQLQESWKKSDEATESIVKNLHAKLNAGRKKHEEIFTETELRKTIYDSLEVQFLAIYKKMSGKIYNTHETRIMRNEPKIHQAALLFDILNASHSDHQDWIGENNDLVPEELWQVNSEFNNSEFSSLQKIQKEWDGLIGSIPSIEISLEELSSIPYNVFSEQSLLATWIRVLDELKVEGSLSTIGESKDPVVIAKQTRYGDAYLQARQLLPKEIEAVIQPNDQVNYDIIETFIRSQPNAMELKSLPKNNVQLRQQQIYQDFIRPILDIKIDQLTNMNPDFSRIARILANPKSNFIKNLVSQIVTKLNLYHITSDERVTLKLTEEDITNQAIASVETLGIEKFFITGDLILNLKEAREKKNREDVVVQNVSSTFRRLREEISTFDVAMKMINERISQSESDSVVKELEAEKSANLTNLKGALSQLLKDLPLAEGDLTIIRKIPINDNSLEALMVTWDIVLHHLKNKIDSPQTPPLERSKNELAYNEIKRNLMFLKGAKFHDARVHMFEALEKPIKPVKDLIKKFDSLNRISSQLTTRIVRFETKILEQQISIPEFNIPLSKASPMVLRNYLKEREEYQNTQLIWQGRIAVEIENISKSIGSAEEDNQSLLESLIKLKKNHIELKNSLEEIQAELVLIRMHLDHPEIPLENPEIITVNSMEVSISSLEEADAIMIGDLFKEINPRYGESFLHSYRKYQESLVELKSVKEEQEKEQSLIKKEIEDGIKDLNPADIRFDELASIQINETNYDLVYLVWNELFVKTLLEKEEITKNLSGSVYNKALQKVIFQLGNLLQVNYCLDHPLINDQMRLLYDKYDEEFEKISVSEFFDVNQKKDCEIVDKLQPTIYEELYPNVDIPDKALPAENENYVTPYEIGNLKIFSKAIESFNMSKEPKLSDDEKKEMTLFIAYALQSGPQTNAMNAKLFKMLRMNPSNIRETLLEYLAGKEKVDDRFFKKIPFGISKDAVELIVDITYKFRFKKEFIPATKKLGDLMQKIKKNEEIKNEDRLTLREFGIVKKAVDIGIGDRSLLNNLKNLGLMNKDLTTLQENSTKAEQLLLELNGLFEQEVATRYHSGDLVAYRGVKEFEYKVHKMNGEQTLYHNFLSPYTHGAKIYRSDSNTFLSHVTSEQYIHHPLDIATDAYSEVWRLDLSKLVSKKMRGLMEAMYGSGWKEIVQKKFEEFENKIHRHEGNQFENIQNPWERQLEAGKADFIWGGHFKKKETDFNKLAERMMGDSEVQAEHFKEMICSEFVTKATIASLVYLDRFFADEIGKYLIAMGKKKEGDALIASKNVFQIPYSRKEKLKAVHPGRMIDALRKRNCITLVPHAPIVSKIFKNI